VVGDEWEHGPRPLPLAPLDAGIDPHASWWGTRWQWMQRALRHEHAATPATVNPLLLYLGMLLSVGGMALAWRRDCRTSTAPAAPPRAGPAADARKIFVGNLASTTTEEDLRPLFAAYGAVERVHLVRHRETGHSRGFAFVTMAHATEAQAAITGLQGTPCRGRPLRVDAARQRASEESPRRPREERRPRG
jgi:RNA recognition motif. (a.k.a. RRM, RBD, or RNP domain)